MDRTKFLKALKQIWQDNAELQEPLTLDDLMDDCATLGIQGAAEMYQEILKDNLEQYRSGIKTINPETGEIQTAL